MAEDKKPTNGGKKLSDRIRDLVQDVVDELKALLDPPQPVPVPVPVGGRRR